MKFIIWLFLILSLLFFIPIPIKIKIYYSLDNYYINIYKFTIFSKEKLSKKQAKNLKNAPPKAKEKRRKKFIHSKIKNISYKKILDTFYKIKFKPFFSFTLDMEYSLNDAAKTAIFYGSLNNFIYPLYIFLCIPFNIKKYKVNIVPKFEDKYLLKVESKSILFISFANIIYMILIILKYIRISEEVAPKK